MPANKVVTAICQRCGAEYEKKSGRALYCLECRIQVRNDRANRYRKQQLETNTEDFLQRTHKSQKKWRDANYEKFYQAVKRNRDKRKFDPEYLKQRSLYNKAAYAKRKGNAKGVIDNLSERGSLQTCERLHVVALHLPCGQREECFKCPKCPTNVEPPKVKGYSVLDSSW